MVASMRRAKPSAEEKMSRVARRHSREARRSRFVLVGGAVLSIVILGAWFPASALYHQHAALASTGAQLDQLHQQDAALAQESKNLSDSAEISRIAREQYQLVSPGQQAYEVLPPTGTSKAGAPYAGDPALKGPASPSSAAVLPPGSVTTTTQPGHAGATSGDSTPPPAAPSGFFNRMLNTLEFWR
jgi:cell division protein FtsB